MPDIRLLFKKKNKRSASTEKLSVVKVFLQHEKHQKTPNKPSSLDTNLRQKQLFKEALSESIINLPKLKKLSWNGIPTDFRSQTWKILLKYTSTNQQNRSHLVERKRKDYFYMVNSYLQNPEVQHDEILQKVFKLIYADVVRTLPQCQLFRDKAIQKIMERILHVWHMRHPSSGYVQGLNDILAPFIIVFLSENTHLSVQKLQLMQNGLELQDTALKNIQADSYWCFTKVLSSVLDNYSCNWNGMQKPFAKLQEVISRTDPSLLQHFTNENWSFYSVYFKWVSCLLLRQFKLTSALRLFDIYLSLGQDFFQFVIYIVAAIFLKFSKQLKQLSFEQLMAFEKKIPTKTWSEEEMATLFAQAYVYENIFKNH